MSEISQYENDYRWCGMAFTIYSFTGIHRIRVWRYRHKHIYQCNKGKLSVSKVKYVR